MGLWCLERHLSEAVGLQKAETGDWRESEEVERIALRVAGFIVRDVACDCVYPGFLAIFNKIVRGPP